MTEVGRLEEHRILVDCRWLLLGGAGRATELVLRGLAAAPPPGRWLLWGPPRTTALAWSGAEVLRTSSDPRAMLGQRAWASLPGCDLAVFLHQIRPLRPVPSLTWVYDTIPLRFAAGAVGRRARGAFLRRVTSISRQVMTTSEYARDCIRRDLRVPDRKVAVTPLPFDDTFVARVAELRRQLPTVDVALYVGRFASHKNLPRLVTAFGRTEFRRGGGKLLLVGGTEDDLRALGTRLGPAERHSVEARPGCSQEELERLFATCRLAVQPSLEEGFGLPAWEALSCGLPLCVSDGGALPEVTRGLVEPFPACSIEAMSRSIDDCVAKALSCPDHAMESSEVLREQAPSVEEFGEAVLQVVAAQLR